MAIAKIKKIEIIGLERDKEEILGLLQRLGLVELISLEAQETDITAQAPSPETNLLEMKEAISYLASFKKESGFFAGIVKIKPLVYAQQLKEVLTSYNYSGLLEELSAQRNHLRHLKQHKEKLIQERQLLTPWVNLDIPLNEIHATRECGILLGILRRADYDNLLKDCASVNLNLHCEPVNQDQANNYLLILYLKEELERLEAILKDHHFNFVTLPHHKGKVQERILEVNREVLVLDDQMQDTKNKLQDLADQQFKLMVIYDYFANLKKRLQVDENLAKQQFTFTLNGWIRQKDRRVIEQALSMRFKDIAIFISDPQKDAVVPVILENKPLIEPFEIYH